MSERDDAEDHEWVRRVLAEAGAHPEPVPDWVGRRVEQTLASLHEGRPDGADGADGAAGAAGAGDSPGAVVEMTPRRHRRWAAGLLAAAALAVGGYSLGATGLLGDAGSGSADSVTAGDAAAGDTGGEAAPVDPGGVTALSSGSLRADARVLAQDLRAGRTGGSEDLAALPTPAPGAARDSLVEPENDSERIEQGYSSGAGEPVEPVAPPQADSQGATSSKAAERRGPRASTRPCVLPPRSVPGTWRPVTFDSEPATAVLRRLDDGRVTVQVWSCQSTRRLAQVTVRP